MSLLVLILILGGGVLLGAISVILAKIRIKQEREGLNTFLDHARGLFLPTEDNDAKSNHIHYILEHYQNVSKIVGEGIYKSPILELGSKLSYARPIDNDLYARIVAISIEYGGEKEREIKQLNRQFFNPFTLLYRGVELVMFFVFGHIIRKFKPDFNQDNSTIWKVFNTLITILGSVASIASFLA